MEDCLPIVFTCKKNVNKMWFHITKKKLFFINEIVSHRLLLKLIMNKLGNTLQRF